ncbi:MAG: hypothetical protein LBD03_07665 [Methanobrevibacter sp.]|jgi:hypothetical protein|nr:hypothetical protein [Candidatus Methanovirga procula]
MSNGLISFAKKTIGQDTKGLISFAKGLTGQDTKGLIAFAKKTMRMNIENPIVFEKKTMRMNIEGLIAFANELSFNTALRLVEFAGGVFGTDKKLLIDFGRTYRLSGFNLYVFIIKFNLQRLESLIVEDMHIVRPYPVISIDEDMHIVRPYPVISIDEIVLSISKNMEYNMEFIKFSREYNTPILLYEAILNGKTTEYIKTLGIPIETVNQLQDLETLFVSRLKNIFNNYGFNILDALSNIPAEEQILKVNNLIMNAMKEVNRNPENLAKLAKGLTMSNGLIDFARIVLKDDYISLAKFANKYGLTMSNGLIGFVESVLKEDFMNENVFLEVAVAFVKEYKLTMNNGFLDFVMKCPNVSGANRVLISYIGAKAGFDVNSLVDLAGKFKIFSDDHYLTFFVNLMFVGSNRDFKLIANFIKISDIRGTDLSACLLNTLKIVGHEKTLPETYIGFGKFAREYCLNLDEMVEFLGLFRPPTDITHQEFCFFADGAELIVNNDLISSFGRNGKVITFNEVVNNSSFDVYLNRNSDAYCLISLMLSWVGNCNDNFNLEIRAFLSQHSEAVNLFWGHDDVQTQVSIKDIYGKVHSYSFMGFLEQMTSNNDISEGGFHLNDRCNFILIDKTEVSAKELSEIFGSKIRVYMINNDQDSIRHVSDWVLNETTGDESVRRSVYDMLNLYNKINNILLVTFESELGQLIGRYMDDDLSHRPPGVRSVYSLQPYDSGNGPVLAEVRERYVRYGYAEREFAEILNKTIEHSVIAVFDDIVKLLRGNYDPEAFGNRARELGLVTGHDFVRFARLIGITEFEDFDLFAKGANFNQQNIVSFVDFVIELNINDSKDLGIFVNRVLGLDLKASALFVQNIISKGVSFDIPLFARYLIDPNGIGEFSFDYVDNILKFRNEGVGLFDCDSFEFANKVGFLVVNEDGRVDFARTLSDDARDILATVLAKEKGLFFIFGDKNNRFSEEAKGHIFNRLYDLKPSTDYHGKPFMYSFNLVFSKGNVLATFDFVMEDGFHLRYVMLEEFEKIFHDLCPRVYYLGPCIDLENSNYIFLRGAGNQLAFFDDAGRFQNHKISNINLYNNALIKYNNEEIKPNFDSFYKLADFIDKGFLTSFTTTSTKDYSIVPFDYSDYGSALEYFWIDFFRKTSSSNLSDFQIKLFNIITDADKGFINVYGPFNGETPIFPDLFYLGKSITKEYSMNFFNLFLRIVNVVSELPMNTGERSVFYYNLNLIREYYLGNVFNNIPDLDFPSMIVSSLGDDVLNNLLSAMPKRIAFVENLSPGVEWDKRIISLFNRAIESHLADEYLGFLSDWIAKGKSLFSIFGDNKFSEEAKNHDNKFSEEAKNYIFNRLAGGKPYGSEGLVFSKNNVLATFDFVTKDGFGLKHVMLEEFMSFVKIGGDKVHLQVFYLSPSIDFKNSELIFLPYADLQGFFLEDNGRFQNFNIRNVVLYNEPLSRFNNNINEFDCFYKLADFIDKNYLNYFNKNFDEINMPFYFMQPVRGYFSHLLTDFIVKTSSNDLSNLQIKLFNKIITSSTEIVDAWGMFGNCISVPEFCDFRTIEYLIKDINKFSNFVDVLRMVPMGVEERIVFSYYVNLIREDLLLCLVNSYSLRQPFSSPQRPQIPSLENPVFLIEDSNIINLNVQSLNIGMIEELTLCIRPTSFDILFNNMFKENVVVDFSGFGLDVKNNIINYVNNHVSNNLFNYMFNTGNGVASAFVNGLDALMKDKIVLELDDGIFVSLFNDMFNTGNGVASTFVKDLNPIISGIVVERLNDAGLLVSLFNDMFNTGNGVASAFVKDLDPSISGIVVERLNDAGLLDGLFNDMFNTGGGVAFVKGLNPVMKNMILGYIDSQILVNLLNNLSIPDYKDFLRGLDKFVRSKITLVLNTVANIKLHIKNGLTTLIALLDGFDSALNKIDFLKTLNVEGLNVEGKVILELLEYEVLKNLIQSIPKEDIITFVTSLEHPISPLVKDTICEVLIPEEIILLFNVRHEFNLVFVRDLSLNSKSKIVLSLGEGYLNILNNLFMDMYNCYNSNSEIAGFVRGLDERVRNVILLSVKDTSLYPLLHSCISDIGFARSSELYVENISTQVSTQVVVPNNTPIVTPVTVLESPQVSTQVVVPNNTPIVTPVTVLESDVFITPPNSNTIIVL